MHHHWDFAVIWQYREAILSGIRVTIELTILACLIGLPVGLPLGIALTARARYFRIPATIITEMLRAAPTLPTLVIAYFLAPVILGFSPSPYWTAVAVFSATFAAFAADVFRGSIRSIPPSTKDAAMALGMSHGVLVKRVIAPEILRRSFPAINAMVVSTLKLSSVASVIAVPELMYTGSLILSDRPRPFEVYAALAFAYIIVIAPVVIILRLLEESSFFRLEPGRSL